MSSSAADSLQNPDFESPPANVTSQVFLLTKANSIPGWSFNGTVWYLTASAKSSFKARHGHAVGLGENGRINQTIRGTADGYWDHILSFNLAAMNEGCAADRHAAVNVTVVETSKVFVLGGNLSRDLWERHAFYLGGWGRGDSVNLEIASVGSNGSCWPVVDAFTVKRNGMPRWYEGNMLANGDFEVGPAFLSNSSDGILLTDEPDRLISPLQQWSVLGTIKYIDSKHYKVPQGKAAVELLSGDPSGIQLDLKLPTTTTYTLNFTMGDGNDACVGDFVVYVQIGVDIHNFTMQSNGTGSATPRSVRFKADSSRETSVSFYSLNETRAGGGVLCGPVLDNIVLVGSYGERIELYNGALVFSLFIALVMLVV
ncbi:hypothetical protein Salat_2734400 [Sesamum alatum]|uniref:DUF642 domain-containing protein n=1 Tax=Sesamum alatum TaxID=300844 RepID=A0AAE1XKQ3_9LAMI|nr:hypothetical protein Salat_2734400 [Sesamum alatum]